MNQENALIIFVRNPELGKVKTRLAATIGEENALRVYKELLRHTRDITQNLPVRKLLFFTGSPDPAFWPSEIYEPYRQEEGDLGFRMEKAFEQAFAEGGRKVIIIGSDCHELQEENISEAFEKLNSHKAVIGPAADGGYYLLGFSALNRSVFQHKTWSTDTVFHDTIRDFDREGLTYAVLPVLHDVDEGKDLNEVLRSLIYG
ncbi:TIGR04282 family arsenosugar biosynthesis glycosyltransferase [Adhaeribacter soli]|uniref:Glycosyltransferase n=1 Tax=Adhaeribacter soli TaxID=2607655 RepID=A0A5N1J5D9_9BACT|nr:TIGR04282 family arsenosugar biosynthesis glycosyltransferase [Adhaeribacter soli]KAA9345914.1 glycosyltransferase [Adhaeribacter soli]